MSLLNRIIAKIILKEPYLSENPFGTKPSASAQDYIRLHNSASQQICPEMNALEQKVGYLIDKAWLDDLALHTQIVIKKSRLNYQHGRLLYSVLRNYLEKRHPDESPVTIFETGTARGFSAICMAKALIDSRFASGRVITIDMLPHNIPIFWNCIDDHEGPKTRQKLLKPWEEELKKIIFIQGITKSQLIKTGLLRIHFAFLDAQHTSKDVLSEYAYVSERQRKGDIIVFDDVTPGQFDGVVQAVEAIEQDGLYSIERIQVSNQRGYAIGTKIF